MLSAAFASEIRADEPVVWTNVVGASASGNTITKTTSADAYDAGGASVNVIRDGSGYVEFSAIETNTYRMAGLGKSDADQGSGDVDFGILLGANQDMYVFEGGNYRGYFGTYAAGDRFRVEVQYGVVRYRKNGVVFLASGSPPPAYPLRVDTSLRSPGSTIGDARVGNLAWANEVGVTVSGSSLTKVGAAGWTSGAISANSIEAADGAMEFTATETNTTRAAGLSRGDTNQDVSDIDFAIKLRDDATIEVVEAGTSRGTFGSYAGGDRFRVEVKAGTVTYSRNGSVFFTSSSSASYPLRVDTALYSASSTLTDVTIDSLVWTNVSGVTAATASLTKTAADGWNAGASSTQTLASGDGFVEFTALETNTRRTVGLKSGTTPAQSYADIDFAIDLSASGAVEVFELGTSRGQFGTYAHGDRLRVEIEGGVVRYLRNGSVLYSSSTSVDAAYPLHAEAALYTSGATVADLSMGDLVWSNAVGVQVFASGLSRPTSAGWNAGASSSRAINSGYIECTASETNTDRMLGLTHTDSDASYTSLDFALYMENGGPVRVYESGVMRAILGTYAPGDRLRIAVENQTVKYYFKDVLAYTSTVTPSLPLVADTSVHSTGAQILNTVMVGAAVITTLNPPTMSPPGGTYSTNQTVTMTAMQGATIRYTTDGSDPTATSSLYSGPLSITQTTTLKAIASLSSIVSAIRTATYTMKVAAPAVSPGSGDYDTPQTVTVTCATPGAEIHYTTNGSQPTQGDAVLTSGGTLAIDAPSTLKVAAWRTGWVPSDLTTAAYGFHVAVPTLVPAGGVFVGALPVTVNTATPGAVLRYRVDGTEPTATDPTVGPGSAVTINHSTTLKVRGWRTAWTPSDVATGSYFINLGTVATPVLTPAPGAFTTPQTVTVTTSTPGALIRYTTDDTAPGLLSPIYSAPLTVGATTVLKARAFASSMTSSATGGGLYAIDGGTADTPRFSPGGGTYPTQRVVTIRSETPGAIIRYRTDGQDPSESDPALISGATLLVDQQAALRARAYKGGLAPSAVTAADYRITGALAVGANFTLAVKSDGTVSSWGRNDFFALGDPSVATGTSRLVPGPVLISDVTAVAAGASHGLALKADGTLWSWGRNYVGELGDGTATDRAQPVQVAGLTNVVAIAAGGDTSLAIKDDASVWIWGQNPGGSPGSYSLPTAVPGLTGVTSVSAGGYGFALAVQTDGLSSGTLWAWGNNQNGQLGDGTTATRTSPVVVAPGVIAAAAGLTHAYALNADGTVVAWGSNPNGQLGDGTFTDHLRPAAVSSLAGVTAITAGWQHGMALKADATVWAWGYNAWGQLGDQTGTTRNVPVAAAITDPLSIVSSSGANHSAAVAADGTGWTWGKNDLGALGDGTTATNAFPKPVPNFILAFADSDGDGLSNAEEAQLGTDPNNADTNGDGISDWEAVRLGISATNDDIDGDGVTNAVERARGTNPFVADSDGDGVSDGQDCFPLDPTRWLCPVDPNDHTPPTITLDEPAGAVPIG